MEVWKYIKGYEGAYKISSQGNIKSLDRSVNGSHGHVKKIKGRVLKPTHDGVGYLLIRLSNPTKGITRRIHRLVADAFILNPSNKPEVNHIDGDKANNAASNLEWNTPKENMAHAVKNGLTPRGSRQWFSKLIEQDVRWIKVLVKSGMPRKEIAKVYNIHTQTVSDIFSRRSWKHI